MKEKSGWVVSTWPNKHRNHLLVPNFYLQLKLSLCYPLEPISSQSWTFNHWMENPIENKQIRELIAQLYLTGKDEAASEIEGLW